MVIHNGVDKIEGVLWKTFDKCGKMQIIQWIHRKNLWITLLKNGVQLWRNRDNLWESG